jgi:hypothetical protein
MIFVQALYEFLTAHALRFCIGHFKTFRLLPATWPALRIFDFKPTHGKSRPFDSTPSRPSRCSN